MPDLYSTTNTQLIPYTPRTIGVETTETVDARELHTFLGVETRYNDWIHRRTAEYGFSQDIDYVVLNLEYGIIKTKEYYVTLDMAKELAMVEKTPKGREARKYFIACEKRLRNSPAFVGIPHEHATAILATTLKAATLLGTPLHIAQVEAVKTAESVTGVSYRALLSAAPAQSEIRPDEEMLEPTELARKLGVRSAIRMNELLLQHGLQERDDGGSWTPTRKGVALCIRHHWVNGSKSGYNWKWKVTAIRHIIQGATK